MVSGELKHRQENGSPTLQPSPPEPALTNHVTHNKIINLSGLPYIPKSIASTLMIIGSPLFAWFYWYACNHHGGSLTAAGSDVGTAISDEGFGNFWRVVYSRLPSATFYTVKIYSIWFLWQACLYAFLPGIVPIYNMPNCAKDSLAFVSLGMACDLIKGAVIIYVGGWHRREKGWLNKI